jgi:hypothetical protein
VAKISRNPRVSDYFIRFDAQTHTDQERREMLASYEGGSLVFFDNCDFGIDYALFEGVDIPRHPDKFVSYLEAKLSMWDYLDILAGSDWALKHFVPVGKRKPHGDPKREEGYQRLKQHMIATALRSPILRLRLARQITAFHANVLAFYERIFPEYGFYEYSINWRLTESRGESLHVDAYRTERDFHQVKLFINLDKAPRIWNTGEAMQTLITRHYDDLGLKRHVDLEYHRFLEACDSAIFDRASGPLDCQATHATFFDQGDVWMAETRQIPHQIFFGRKMVSVQVYIDPSKRIAPERSMKAFVEALQKRPSLALA